MELFRIPKMRMVSRHGISFDIQGLTVWISNPADLSTPTGYAYPELIKDWRDMLFGDHRDDSLLYQRLRRWPTEEQPVDQLASIVSLLRGDENSRSAVFSVWQPGKDPGSPFSISPVGGACRIVEETLLLFLTARSVDVWMGMVPELLAFSQLAMDLALELNLGKSRICYHAWSAHLYELDYLTYFGEAAT